MCRDINPSGFLVCPTCGLRTELMKRNYELASLVLRRVLGALPVLLIVSLITFGMMRLIPGDPSSIMGGMSATPAQLAQIRTDLGLDEPFTVQLLRWYGGLLHGNLGRSILMGQDVMSVTLQRLPVTIALSAYALVITLVLGLASGILAALRHNTWVDQLAMMIAMLGISIPNFFLGLLMIIFFAVQLGWLPTGGDIAFPDEFFGLRRPSPLPAISLPLLPRGLPAPHPPSPLPARLRPVYIR